MDDLYGKRRVPRMLNKVNNLRLQIAKEGSPAIQDAWGEVEEFIDYFYQEVGRQDNEAGLFVPADSA